MQHSRDVNINSKTLDSMTRKKWSSVYEKKICNEKQKLDLASTLSGIIHLKRIVGSVVRKTRARVAIARLEKMCTRSIESLESPSSTEWSKHWGNSSSICIVCNSCALTDVIFCKYCGYCAHRLCIEMSDYFIEKDTYSCHLCEESNSHDENFYYKNVERLGSLNKRRKAGLFLVRKIKGWIFRRRHLLLRRATVCIQAWFRRYKTMKGYLKLVRPKYYVLVLELTTLPRLVLRYLNDFVFVLVALDPLKHMHNCQVYRVDKSAEACLNGEAFLLPGSNYYLTIVLSLVMKFEHSYVLISQAQLPLRDLHNHLKGHVISVSLSHVTVWPPLENKFSSHLPQIFVLPGLSGCPSASHLEPLRAAMSKKGLGHVSLLETRAQARCMFQVESMGFNGTALDTNEVTISYSPQSFSTSMCLTAFAPSLDAIKKLNGSQNLTSQTGRSKATYPSPISLTAAPGSGMPLLQKHRLRSWWVCVIDLRLLFFEALGATRPHFSLDLAETLGVSMIRSCESPKKQERGHRASSQVNILLATGSTLCIQCPVFQDALHFVHIVEEGKRALLPNDNPDSGSIFVSSSSLRSRRKLSYGL